MNLILISAKCIYQEGDKFYFRTTARQTSHLRTILKVEINQRVKVGVINKGKGEGIVIKEEESNYVIQLVNPIHLENTESNFIPIDIVLCVPRPKILDKLLQQLSSVGVKKIIIVFSEYSNKCYESSKKLKNEEIKNSLQLGLEQAMCTKFPDVYIHYTFNSFFMNFKKYADTDTIKLCAHTDVMKASFLNPFPILNKDEGKILLMIGCERGFSDFEIYLLKKLEFQFFHLSSRIFKCESAFLIIIGQLLLLTENTELRPSGNKMRRNSNDRKKEALKQTEKLIKNIEVSTKEVFTKEVSTKEVSTNNEKKHLNNYLTEQTEKNQIEEVKRVLKTVLKNETDIMQELKNYLVNCIDNYEADINNNVSVGQKKESVINFFLKRLKDFNKHGCDTREDDKAINNVTTTNEENFQKNYISLLFKQIKYQKHLDMSYNNVNSISDMDGVYIYKTKKYETKKNTEQKD